MSSKGSELHTTWALTNGQKSGNNFHFFRHILSCTAKTNKHGVKNYIWQFKHTLGPSFCQLNIIDKLSILLRYNQMKVQTYLLFVIFCTPAQFSELKIVRQKAHKFTTIIASRQNSVNQYLGLKLREGCKKKRPVFIVFYYEGVRTPPPFIVTWDSENFWSIF